MNFYFTLLRKNRISTALSILFFSKSISKADDLSSAIKTYVKNLQAQAASISKQDISDLVSDLFVQGLVEMCTNQYEKAFESINNAIKLDPSNACLHYKMAQILEKCPKFAYRKRFILDAISHIYAAIELSESTKLYYYTAISMHLSNNQIEAAINVYEQLVKSFQPTTSDLMSLAELYMEAKNFKQAIKIYSQLEQKLGIVQEIINEKHKAFIALKEMEMAISEKLKLCSSMPDNQDTIVELTILLKENGQEYVALDYLKGHIAVYPNHFQALTILVETLIEKNLLSELNPYMANFIKSNAINYNKKVEVLDSFVRQINDNQGYKILDDLVRLLISQYPYQDTYVACADLYKILGDEAKYQELNKKARLLNGQKAYPIYMTT